MAQSKTKKANDKPADADEIRLLRNLELSERRIASLHAQKAEEMAEWNETIKGETETRNSILQALEDHRNGVRSLPLE